MNDTNSFNDELMKMLSRSPMIKMMKLSKGVLFPVNH